LNARPNVNARFKRRFILPTFRYKPHTTRASVQVTTGSSAKRIVEQTPTLRDLYAFLARPLPSVEA